ncbi:hypothetical protein M2132_000008 [Dysgonomonas sp. PH5-45]|uniref:T9SS type A sorting domain-containing protein n=1 Tax=unclassified Dysgonomonas TaxID=2630389 RepID=UPI002472FD86|nr:MULTISPECIES: T9SS type A sorting domain-containing protein [unclassified Dysgonomonas]MDH6353691.1 hypothetical protein [Dysgonomonas sp. PH5-45]MDH6386594.1 hypothetical protein [Dysgonomonas sp. PH5-37]
MTYTQRLIISSIIGIGLIVLPKLLYSQSPGDVGSPELWMKTKGTGIPLKYQWMDYSGDHLKLYTYNYASPSQKQEYLTDSVRFYNGHPAIMLKKQFNNQIFELPLKYVNLAQSTVIGVFAPNSQFSQEVPIYSLSGRSGTDYTQGTDKVYYLPLDTLDYGKSEGMDLRTSARESSMCISSHYRSLIPHNGIWGGKEKASFAFPSPSPTNLSFSGYIPEIIAYNRFLTPLERQKVESYLAIKYGITLPVSYIGSNGQLLWNITEQTKYNNRITGLCKDDASGLDQTEAATSYEEAPYYTYMQANDYFHKANPENGSSTSRLLTIGRESISTWSNYSHLLWGDNNQGLKPERKDYLIGMKLMPRHWLVNTQNLKNESYYVELSYADGKASGFKDHVNGSSYLMINNSGSDEFQQTVIRYVEVSGIDALRKKAIYNNVLFDIDGNYKDVFTFVYCDSPIAGDIDIKHKNCNNDGELHIRIIKGERVFFYKLKDVNSGEVIRSGNENSYEFDINGLSAGEYELYIEQRGGYSFENLTRATPREALTTNPFPAQGGSLKWVVTDLTDNYTVGFKGTASNILYHGISKEGNTLSLIISNVSTPSGIQVALGDELEVKFQNNKVSFYKNGVRIGPNPTTVAATTYYGFIDMSRGFLELRNLNAVGFTTLYDWITTGNVTKIYSEQASVVHTLTLNNLCSRSSSARPNQSDEDSSTVIEEAAAEVVNFSCIQKNLNLTAKLQFEKPDVVSFLIYNTTGQLILKEENMSLQQIQSADFHLPSKGVYIIKAFTRNHGEFTRKIIAE